MITDSMGFFFDAFPKEMKDLSNTDIEMQNMKCPKCEYECKKKVTLSKHMNTEHKGIHSNAQVCSVPSVKTHLKDRTNLKNILKATWMK